MILLETLQHQMKYMKWMNTSNEDNVVWLYEMIGLDLYGWIS